MIFTFHYIQNVPKKKRTAVDSKHLLLLPFVFLLLLLLMVFWFEKENLKNKH